MDERLDSLIALLTEQNLIFREMQRSLQTIAGSFWSVAPNIQKPIGAYPGFDWSSIGATVLKKDDDGPSIVECNGKVYKRRAPDNKFEASIWFSRCTGKDSDGGNQYETLISFDVIRDDVEPLGSKARQVLAKTRATRQAEPVRTPATPAEQKAEVRKADVLPIENRPLTDEQMSQIAQTIVAGNGVSKTENGYRVQVNPKTVFDVTKAADGSPQCNCERFKPGVRCQHIRAVAIWTTQSAKPDSRSELKMLVTDLLDAGYEVEEIDAMVARVCDGICEIERLNAGQIAKALRSLSQKLEERKLKVRASA
jgi:hypothetical protein